MASIDNADWHACGDYPAGLPHENSGTHIGLFLAWVLLRGLGSRELTRLAGELVPDLRDRRITGRDLLFSRLDGKLFPSLLTREGRAFARFYYASNLYFGDYDQVLGSDLPSLYHVDDSWTNFDRLAPSLDARLRAWRAQNE